MAAAEAGIWATLWQQPRRSPARRVLFQVHLWLGVLLGIYTVVVGLTGSALVFRPEIEAWQRPELVQHTAAQSGERSVTAELAGVSKVYAGQPIEGIDNLDQPSHAAVVYLEAPHGEERMVYLDQSTGGVLGDRFRYSGVLGTCAALHVYLLGGPVGYLINGFCACAFLVLCLTGWLLWWPGSGKLTRALRIHWASRANRRNWDLHTVGGFWSNPALLVVILTGILFVFPKPVLLGLSLLTGGSSSAVTTWLEAPQTSGGTPLIAADFALAITRAALPRSPRPLRVRYLAVPSPGSPIYEAIAYPEGGADYAMPVHVSVDAHTGRVLAIRDARALPPGMRWATYSYAVHFGTFAGFASRVVWVAVGLMPALLWTTGLLLWWNRSLRPRWS